MILYMFSKGGDVKQRTKMSRMILREEAIEEVLEQVVANFADSTLRS